MKMGPVVEILTYGLPISDLSSPFRHFCKHAMSLLHIGLVKLPKERILEFSFEVSVDIALFHVRRARGKPSKASPLSKFGVRVGQNTFPSKSTKSLLSDSTFLTSSPSVLPLQDGGLACPPRLGIAPR